ncbi:hypothetical protein Tco_1171975, partial [Tanacetum coccineum]
MISLDGGEFTDPKVSRKITSILKTMFNGSWTTWKEVDKSARDEFWAHFKNEEEMLEELKEDMHEVLKEEMRAEIQD